MTADQESQFHFLITEASGHCRFNLTDLYGLLRTERYTLIVSRTLGDRTNVPAPTLTTYPLKFQIRSATAPQNAPVTPFTHDPSADENIP